MRIAIDIVEAVNGWRLDILEEGKKPRLENCETFDQVMRYVKIYAEGHLKFHKQPIRTLEIV